MTISLSPQAQKLLNARLKTGRYASAEEALVAGLQSLRRQEEMGEFGRGEIRRLVAEGERSIEREGTVGADEVFAALRHRAKSARAGNGASNAGRTPGRRRNADGRGR